MKQSVKIILLSMSVIVGLYGESDTSLSLREKMQKLEQKILIMLDVPDQAVQVYIQFAQDPENHFYIDRQYELLRMRGELLLLATAFGHIEVVKELLRQGVFVDVATYFGKTALFYAVENNHEDIAKLLLDYGADMYACSKYNETPVSLASRSPHLAYLFQMYATN